jgi:hypothetical protein
VNADGFTDVFVASGMGYPFGYSMNALLLNEGGRRFFDAEFLLGIEPRKDGQVGIEYFILDCSGEDKDHPSCQGQSGKVSVHGVASSRSSAIFDLDDDGDLDLVTHELLDKPQVFISNLSDRRPVNFLKVALRGRASNRDGLGAVVRVTAGGRSYVQSHDGKSGYLSHSSSIPLYFGLGSARTVERVEVAWPSGAKQAIEEGLRANTTLRVEESQRP